MEKNTHTNGGLGKRLQRHVAVWTAVLLLASTALPSKAQAASSWNPTLLVNTESFQVIDEGDSSTNIEIRFGGTLNEKILYDRTNNRFTFSRSVKIGGALTTTGSAIINVGNTTATADAGIALEVLGTASGQNIFATKSMTGTHVYAAQTFAGAGLTGCTGAANKITWNATTKQFACETDQQGAGAQFSTGSLTNGFDRRYVNISGDSMTGGLLITTVASGVTPPTIDAGLQLELIGVGSGRTLHAHDALQSSGTLVVDGAASLKSNLTINSDNGAVDTILTFGSNVTAETLTFINAEDRFEFSDDVHVTGNITGSGTLTVDGNAATKANLTINSDNGAADATLTFGSDGTAETVNFLNNEDRFQFSDDIHTTGNITATGTLTVDGNIRGKAGIRAGGNLSGSTLTVDGNVTIRGNTYTFPIQQGTSGNVLRTNGNGTLSWGNVVAAGSGDVLTLNPEYSDAVYFSSGAVNVGTMTYSYDATNLENFYRWTTSKGTLQDYWVSTRVQLPKNFTHFESASGIVLRLRTTSTSAANNYLTVRLLDTNGNAVNIGNNAQLTSSSASTWRTNTITGVTNGTYAAGGYITVLVKTAATTTNNTDLGYLKFNWSTNP